MGFQCTMYDGGGVETVEWWIVDDFIVDPLSVIVIIHIVVLLKKLC